MRHDRPLDAAAAFDRAGPGTELERLRMDLWFQSLDQGNAGPGAWRAFLDQGPPNDLIGPARAALGERLMEEGRLEAANVALGDDPASDLVRLRWPDAGVRTAAAVRLAASQPRELRKAEPDLEAGALAALDAEARIDRAVAWRVAGSFERCARELRALKAADQTERRRRRELARCELARGRTTRALSILPSLRRSDAEEALVRAKCWLRRGWSRHPGRRSIAAFRECADAAMFAADRSRSSGAEALEVALECSTESGDLDRALTAWNRLAVADWEGSRRAWLGRRLGMALVGKADRKAALDRLENSLPTERRSLQFAAARSSDDGVVLRRLAEAGIADRYGLRSREILGLPAPASVELGPPIRSGSLPAAVAWLVDLGETGLASVEWRRQARAGRLAPDRVLAAAEFEWDRGRADLAIRGLWSAFPELGSTSIGSLPANVVRAYLPVPWVHEVRSAADEFGLEPWLLAGLARQESLFNPRAVSPAGARGLVQLMIPTARGHARALGLGRSPDLFDPETNLRLGARELAALTDRFGSIDLALAAYNGGATRVRRWHRTWPDVDRCVEAIPVRETYTYVRRVRFLSEAYRLVWPEVWSPPDGD